METNLKETTLAESDDCVVNLLHSLQLRPQRIGEDLYAFDSDSFCLLYFPSRESSKSFTIAIPRIYNIETSSDKSVVASYVNHVNNLIPSIKLSIIDQDVWAVYESIDISNRINCIGLTQIICRLKEAAHLFHALAQVSK